MFGRILLAMIMALALALGPMAIPGGEAMAAAAPAHHGDEMAAAMDHCDEQQQPDRQDKADNSCCVAGCMAVAALPAPALEPTVLSAARDRPAPDRFRLGYLGEIATPPPRTV